MATKLYQNQAEAISRFLNDPKNGEVWRQILFEAPAYAMERIAISMYHSVFGESMTPEEKSAYRALREEIEATLKQEDLEYLIKVMPQKQKEHYQSLLSLLPSETNDQQPIQQNPQKNQDATATV